LKPGVIDGRGAFVVEADTEVFAGLRRLPVDEWRRTAAAGIEDIGLAGPIVAPADSAS
jgi:hypothetical protein